MHGPKKVDDEGINNSLVEELRPYELGGTKIRTIFLQQNFPASKEEEDDDDKALITTLTEPSTGKDIPQATFTVILIPSPSPIQCTYLASKLCGL